MKTVRTLLAVCAGVLVVTSAAVAAAFDAEMQLATVTGTCEVQMPGASGFVPATQGQKCAYGASIKTGKDSTCLVKFSADNTCLVKALTTVQIERSGGEVTVRLGGEGGVEVNLEKNFREKNQLKVVTPSAVCEALSCIFGVDHKVVADMQTSTFSGKEGDVSINGEYFSLSGLGAGESVVVSRSPRGDVIRIRIGKGDVSLTVRDADGSAKKIALTTNDEVEISVAPSPKDPSMVIVTYRIRFADGTKPPLTWQSTQPRAFGPPAGWLRLHVQNPTIVTPTPVGRR